MLFIRPSKLTDLESLLALSQQVGKGMTSMPYCRSSWQRKLESSQRAFNAQSPPRSCCYFLVLEDSASGKIVGTTAIYTGIGTQQPFYSYQRSSASKQAKQQPSNSETLTLVDHFKGYSEVGSLFLLPEYRQPGVGQMLARARYLLMADYPERFSTSVMAELRGFLDAQGLSPLWQSLGRQFFDMDFSQAVHLCATQGTGFITERLSKQPVAINTLSVAARECLSMPNHSSAPALQMLYKEGFSDRGLIDVLDGGPRVEASLKKIKTIVQSKRCSAIAVANLETTTDLFYLTNTQLKDFRVIQCPAEIRGNGALVIDQKSADLLALNEQQLSVRYAEVMHRAKSQQAKPQAA